MRYGYFPGPEWNFSPEEERRYQQSIDQKAKENSPLKVLTEMLTVFGISLAVILLIDAVVLLIVSPASLLHFG